MKNKEKYEACVLTFACDECGFGVYEKTGKMENCMKMQCTDCLFYVKKETCRTNRRKWLESEYVKKPVISKRDRAFLECLDKNYEYIARDNDDYRLYVYNAKPSKGYSFWKEDSGKGLYFDGLIDIDFPMVKWSDEEPWLIEDLKKLKVVEQYE